MSKVSSSTVHKTHYTSKRVRTESDLKKGQCYVFDRSSAAFCVAPVDNT